MLLRTLLIYGLDQQRPDLAAPALDVSINDAGRVSPGYIFIAPFQTAQAGPYIYDSNGVGCPSLQGENIALNVDRT